jgi:selenocysteine lyase/cysteine desulfurase
MLSFEEARKLFPITGRYIYLALAAMNPGASTVTSAISSFFEDLQSGKGSMWIWQDKILETKENISRLIHCYPEEICLVKNTSEGLNIAANGIHFRRGDNVIINDLENPNNIYNWLILRKKRGIKVKIIRHKNCRLELDDFISEIDTKTRAISLSHVTPYYGFRSDLKELSLVCRKKGIYLVVDGIQAVGVIKADVKELGIDLLACGGHKGLLGTFGTGFLYLDRETCQGISPTYQAGASMKGGSEFPYEGIPFEDARRFEIGNQNYPGFYGLNEGIKLILEIGIERIEQRVRELTDLLVRRLQESEFRINSSLRREERSGILSFNVPDPLKLQEQLKERGIVVSVRRNAIRISPHFYNTEKEIETFVATTVELTGRKGPEPMER